MGAKIDLPDRLLAFSVEVIKFLRKLPNVEEYRIIKYQLIKSSSSSGANYEEAQGASSRKDFKNKIFISLKEMRESNYWMKIIERVNKDRKLIDEIKNIKTESEELKKILGAIASKLNDDE